MESYYKNEPLRTYGVPIRSRDYVDEYDSMSTGDRIADILGSLQQASIDRRGRDLAFLGDLQDFAKTKSPEERDTALMEARTLTPMDEEVQAIADRKEGKSFDIDAILADEPDDEPDNEPRTIDPLFQRAIDQGRITFGGKNINADEARRRLRIKSVRGNEPRRIDPLFQRAVDQGRISFSGKNFDEVLAEIKDKPAFISDEDMADRIVSRTRNKIDPLFQKAVDEGRITFRGRS